MDEDDGRTLADRHIVNTHIAQIGKTMLELKGHGRSLSASWARAHQGAVREGPPVRGERTGWPNEEEHGRQPKARPFVALPATALPLLDEWAFTRAHG